MKYNEEATFAERVKEITSGQKTMYRHLKYPFSEISKRVKEVTDSTEKLYDIVYSYQNARSDVKKIDILFDITWIPSDN
jgi:hypothetical protein